jgi:hypothetical protein
VRLLAVEAQPLALRNGSKTQAFAGGVMRSERKKDQNAQMSRSLALVAEDRALHVVVHHATHAASGTRGLLVDLSEGVHARNEWISNIERDSLEVK